jgi:hypothetical protein
MRLFYIWCLLCEVCTWVRCPVSMWPPRPNLWVITWPWHPDGLSPVSIDATLPPPLKPPRNLQIEPMPPMPASEVSMSSSIAINGARPCLWGRCAAAPIATNGVDSKARATGPVVSVGDREPPPLIPRLPRCFLLLQPTPQPPPPSLSRHCLQARSMGLNPRTANG